jgi:nicotinic acid mononucleotide adenylyltransferase
MWNSIAETPTPMDISTYIRDIYKLNTTVQKNLLSLCVTGGAVSSIQSLLTVSGASQCVQTVSIPYARIASKNILHRVSNTEQHNSLCNEEVATLLAKSSFHESLHCYLAEHRTSLSTAQSSRVPDSTSQILGIGCTAALVSDVPKKGEHRCFISIVSSKKQLSVTLSLQKGARCRLEEDKFCSAVLISTLGEFLSLPPLFNIGSELVARHEEYFDVKQSLQRLYQGKVSNVLIIPDGRADATTWFSAENAPLPETTIIFPGSFNPLHDGHVLMCAAAVQHIRANGSETPMLVFEIAAVNADKPSIDMDELIGRLQQFHESNMVFRSLAGVSERPVIAVCVTSKPLFVEKARLFKDVFTHFLMGADTMRRVVDLKYYLTEQNDEESLLDNDVEGHMAFASMINTLSETKSSILVCGRITHDKIFDTMENIAKDSELLRWSLRKFPALFDSIPESSFRVDLSSTAIRNQRVAKDVNNVNK